MAKGLKLKDALDRYKGVDHKQEHQKRLVKKAEKRKRTSAEKNIDSNDVAQVTSFKDHREKSSKRRKVSRDQSKSKFTVDTKPSDSDDDEWNTDEDDDNSDVVNGSDLAADSDDDDSDSAIEFDDKGAQETHTNGAQADSEDEQDEDEEGDIALSDLESLASEEKGDMIPHQRLTINNKAALSKAYKSIALPSDLTFTANQTIVSIEPVEIKDVDDDLGRELAFYKQALDAVTRAKSLLKAEGAPFSRPADFFAEMVKSEEHMGKIKSKLVNEAASKKAAAEARKQRDLKKFGKQVQVAKLQERDRTKRETLDRIKMLKKKRSGAEITDTHEEDMFDVALDNEGGDSSGKGGRRTSGSGKPKMARAKRDEKYGFGGKKRFSKSNDARSTNDTRGPSHKMMKGGSASIKSLLGTHTVSHFQDDLCLEALDRIMISIKSVGIRPFRSSRSSSLRRQARSITTDSSAIPPPHPPLSGAVRLFTRRIIELYGRDAPKFLQGIITNNVKPGSRSGFFTAFLTAQGRVINDAFIFPTLSSIWHKTETDEPGYLIDVDAHVAEAVLAQIKKHKLRAKFSVRLLEADEANVWSTWRAEEKWTPHSASLGEDDVQLDHDTSNGVLSLTDSRASSMGTRVLVPNAQGMNSFPAEHPTFQCLEAPLSAYTIRRYLRGVIEGSDEIPTGTYLPMNINMDTMNGIDFKKGCYLGQELTIRTHHTGVVRKRILPVVLYASDEEPPSKLEYCPEQVTALVTGKEAEIKAETRRQKSGNFIAGVGNIGLAMCRLEHMTDLEVMPGTSSHSPQDRFSVMPTRSDGTETELGIKAFVPDWLRNRVRPAAVQQRVGD